MSKSAQKSGGIFDILTLLCVSQGATGEAGKDGVPHDASGGAGKDSVPPGATGGAGNGDRPQSYVFKKASL